MPWAKLARTFDRAAAGRYLRDALVSKASVESVLEQTPPRAYVLMLAVVLINRTPDSPAASADHQSAARHHRSGGPVRC